MGVGETKHDKQPPQPQRSIDRVPATSNFCAIGRDFANRRLHRWLVLLQQAEEGQGREPLEELAMSISEEAVVMCDGDRVTVANPRRCHALCG